MSYGKKGASPLATIFNYQMERLAHSMVADMLKPDTDLYNQAQESVRLLIGEAMSDLDEVRRVVVGAIVDAVSVRTNNHR